MMHPFPEKTARGIFTLPVGQREVSVEWPTGALSQDAPFLVMCHPHPQMGGTMDNKVVTTTLKAFQQLGLLTLRFNYRGVGKSTGQYGNMQGESEDLASVVAWVRQYHPERAVWLAGFSFGAYIAYRLANVLSAAQLLTIAPAVTADTYPCAPLPAMPWTVIVPDADEVVSVSDTLHWLNTVSCEYRLLKLSGVSHFFHGALIRLKQALQLNYGALATWAQHE